MTAAMLLRPMHSAYAKVQGTEPEFTNWARRMEDDEFKGSTEEMKYRTLWLSNHNVVVFFREGGVI